jgi:hypothetical protein
MALRVGKWVGNGPNMASHAGLVPALASEEKKGEPKVKKARRPLVISGLLV